MRVLVQVVVQWFQKLQELQKSDLWKFFNDLAKDHEIVEERNFAFFGETVLNEFDVIQDSVKYDCVLLHEFFLQSKGSYIINICTKPPTLYKMVTDITTILTVELLPDSHK